MGETATLARFVSDATFDDLPAETVEKSKEAVRDYLGVALYGSHHDVGRRIADYVDAAASDGPATVLCRGSAGAPAAALANGTFGHAIDYDDTFESIVIHPTSPVFGATLAAVEAAAVADDGAGTDSGGANADADSAASALPASAGRDALCAYAVGCEVAYRVGHATYPSHYDNGWHATGTVGGFGAAAAAASALGLDAGATRHAFGVVASSSSSLKKNFGTMTKPLHAGHAAQMGVRAALLADAGFTADDAVLEGDLGYGEVMTPGGEYDPATVTEGLDALSDGDAGADDWAVHDIGYKPYPSGVITHAAMDAMRSLVREHDLSPENVERVVVALDEAANEMLIRSDAGDELEAKFSIEFCLAAVLREGDAGVHEFTDEYVTAPETRAAMEKVERDFEEDLFGGGFAGYGARVRVETVEGETYAAEERDAPGGPSNPLSEERLRAKFDESARAVLSDDDADAAADAVARLDDDGALSDLLRRVRVSEAPDSGGGGA